MESLGGKVIRDDISPRKPVTRIDPANTKVTDAELKQLGPLTNLAHLGLDGTQVSDAGLKELASLTKLERLYLDGTQVTDAGIEEIQKALSKCNISK